MRWTRRDSNPRLKQVAMSEGKTRDTQLRHRRDSNPCLKQARMTTATGGAQDMPMMATLLARALDRARREALSAHDTRKITQQVGECHVKHR